jgi:hypothetical protein
MVPPAVTNETLHVEPAAVDPSTPSRQRVLTRQRRTVSFDASSLARRLNCNSDN